MNLHNAKCVTTQEECCSILIRKNRNLKNIKQAKITVASFGFFYGYINGKKISDDLFVPLSTNYHERKNMIIRGIPFDEEMGCRLYCPVYDITDLLNDGFNSVCFMVGPGWYAHNDWGVTQGYGQIKICYCLEVTHKDGTVSYIVSDENDKSKEGFVKEGDILTGETHDYTNYDSDWLMTDYDDTNWDSVKIEPMPDTNLYVQDCPADKIIRTIKPIKVSESNGVKVYDVGEIISGYPVASIKGGYENEIKIRYGELLNDDKSLKEENIYNQYTNIKVGEKDKTVDTHFTWYCFRYFEVTGECEIDECLVIYTDTKVTSLFKSDDETLNWLYDAFIRTQLANMHAGIPSDCPHVERKGYTGDGQLTCRAVMSFLDVKKFYKKWIYDISDCQDKKTGHVQYTAPYWFTGGGPGGWGGAIVLVPYYYYKQYGDVEILKELYSQMIQYFDYLETHSENDLVTSDRENGWCLGEWCTPDQILLNDKDGVKVPPPFVNTYFYIKTMQIVIEIENILGINQNQNMLHEKIKNKKAALVKNYFDYETGDFCDNKQGANAFAIDIEIGDNRTFEHMVENYKRLGRYDTGIFGTEIVTRLLFEKGYPEVALSLLTSKADVSFYSQRKTGATTLLENWNGVRSQCHPMFGAVSVYLVEYILGIKQTSVGYESIVIEPMCMKEIKHASGHITTEKGVIAVDYDENEIRVTIPNTIEAEVIASGKKVKYINI